MGVVLENSSVTCPSHSGSKGVTFTIIPHLAYVLFPRQIVKTLRGMRKNSTVLASAKEFGGAAHVVAVARRAVGHDFMAVRDPHLLGRERLDHAGAGSHAPDPTIALD